MKRIGHNREPVFAPGGMRRLGAFAIALGIGAVVTIIVGVAMSPLEPVIRSAAHALF